ncbi:hypothetical protein AB0G48_34715, partial [Streptomyces rubiginosohelvolus]|uniref:hypothetical protein n=1 Tax=Streptomyces rubiginosohelvolus TaxID=67362 RepID=UPI0033CE3A20
MRRHRRRPGLSRRRRRRTLRLFAVGVFVAVGGFEIVLGVLVGPDVLGWAHHDQVIDTLSDLG